jgi:hypothetical protein
VYVDEFVAVESSQISGLTNRYDVFVDQTRQARIRVEYFPEGSTEPDNTIDYVVTQRSVYPVQATHQEIKVIDGVEISSGQKYTYGIEYFEEYLYNYDDPRIQDSDDFSYDATQDGMEWGLDGVQLSRLNKSVNFSDITLSNTYLDDILDALLNIGIDLKSQIAGIINTTIDAEGLPFYDFYIGSDNVGEGRTKYSYDGITMGFKLKKQYSIPLYTQKALPRECLLFFIPIFVC